MSIAHFKDEILNELAGKANVAQFVSYGPGTGVQQRFLHINGEEPNNRSMSAKEAISLLIERSSEKRVNVRSFDPFQPKGHPFTYGLTTCEEVLAVIATNAANELYSIVNETIDVNDGGVSGVALGNIIEFTPGDTPKGVEKPGVCQMHREMGISILNTIYGFEPEIDFGDNIRVEFSIHPLKRGIKMENTIIWELEAFDNLYNNQMPSVEWPNNFSKVIGDKAFGLLVANYLSLPVPITTVIGRVIAPFKFGYDTGLEETWIRTAPIIRTPGKYSTFKGWVDPFKLLANEDPYHDKIASVLSQQAVKPIYSGSLLTDIDNNPYIEGTEGRGDLFMIGEASTQQIPVDVENKIKYVFSIAFKSLGPVEMEWVYDGDNVWIVQLHKSQFLQASSTIIVEGNPLRYIDFDIVNGLDQLRQLISELQSSESKYGIKLIGNIGITSHMGDVLRKSGIPSIIQRA